jgi:hypothetical protein
VVLEVEELRRVVPDARVVEPFSAGDVVPGQLALQLARVPDLLDQGGLVSPGDDLGAIPRDRLPR